VLQLLVGSLRLVRHNLAIVALYAPRLCYSFFLMATRSQNPDPELEPGSLYCPTCAEEVTDPLTCGDCSSVICRRCGTALESSDELGIG
jgi:hypothetical protein